AVAQDALELAQPAEGSAGDEGRQQAAVPVGQARSVGEIQHDGAAVMPSHPYASRPVAKSHVWLTPPAIVAALGLFDLDPCAAPNPRPWPTALRHIELPEHGLPAAWSGRVWCNPPFGEHTWAWLERMGRHGNGIALAFARTETVGFHRWVWNCATAVMFLKG